MEEFFRDHPLDDVDVEDGDVCNDLEHEAEIRRDELAGFFVPR